MKTISSTLRSAVSPARSAAFDMLIRIERESSYASELLHSQAYSSLSSVDHSLAMELVMGVLRWRGLLDSKIAESSSQPLTKLDLEILTALRLAIYQLRFLDRIPARAAIHESVELVKRARKRSAAPFVNAVLRKIATRLPAGAGFSQQIQGDSVALLAASSAHPAWIVERWAHTYGLEASQKICAHDQSIPVAAIRLRHPDVEALLRVEGIDLVPGALLASARRVQHGDVSQAAAFREGLCVMQDEASQLVAALVGDGMQILDCCAAPGGKTRALADRNPNAQLTAAELHIHRSRLLKRLLATDDVRTNQIHIVAADARRMPFAGKFDRVLADVPCSGTGTLARNPEIKWRLRQEDLDDLQKRQLEILRSAMDQVAAGGRVIYSTCSLEREENETVVELALANQTSFSVLDCSLELDRLQRSGELQIDPVSLTSGPYLRTLPGLHPCDGFFAAIIEKEKPSPRSQPSVLST